MTRTALLGLLGVIGVAAFLSRKKTIADVPEGAIAKGGGFLFGPRGSDSGGFDFSSSEIQIPLECDGPVFVGSDFVSTLINSDFMQSRIVDLGNRSPESLTFEWLESVSPQCASVPLEEWGKPLLDAYDFILAQVTEYLEGVE